MYVLIVVIDVALFRTRWGLRTRAVGEHPKAADTVGIRVLRMRYQNVILGGMVAGLGGALPDDRFGRQLHQEHLVGQGLHRARCGDLRAVEPARGDRSRHCCSASPTRWQTLLSIIGTPVEIPSSFLAHAALPRHAVRGRRARRPRPGSGGGRPAVCEGLNMQTVDWPALRRAALEAMGRRTRRTRSSRSARPRWSTTGGSSSAATSRTPRTGWRCAPSAGWSRRCTRAAAAGSSRSRASTSAATC